jgi:hypothetical protein
MRASAITIVCGLICAGCATNPGGVAYQRVDHPVSEPAMSAPNGSSQRAVATQIPWQLTPASTASEAQGERTSVRYVRKMGRVRGTDIALANLGKPMTAYPGAHSVVQPCRHAMLPQAARIGAYSVEAAAAGPEQHLRGSRRQQVFFRILYRNENGIEVRQAALMCTLNVRGTVIAAKPV